MTKIIQEDRMKTFVENFLDVKQAKFYMKGIKKPVDNWQMIKIYDWLK